MLSHRYDLPHPIVAVKVVATIVPADLSDAVTTFASEDTVQKIILKSTAFENGRLELPVHRLPLVMGRSKTCDIPMKDGLLSRRHAEIRLNASGRVEIRDLDSTNLTIVNATDVDRCELKTGDELLLGDTRIVIEIVSADSDFNEQTTREFIRPEHPGRPNNEKQSRP